MLNVTNIAVVTYIRFNKVSVRGPTSNFFHFPFSPTPKLCPTPSHSFIYFLLLSYYNNSLVITTTLMALTLVPMGPATR